MSLSISFVWSSHRIEMGGLTPIAVKVSLLGRDIRTWFSGRSRSIDGMCEESRGFGRKPSFA
ncbi:hypothetical protein ACPOL_4251 [Acidisarcina polymorpha]|uniref:Uncharacterized protein n=1 Tax=Acidisarcina polymorpha TaxID=2211140 RepID=A0A2Z5G4S6_9BACT|nr:hypothetical protein ACPOL_4251 [Acidisarcina polymorpha]